MEATMTDVDRFLAKVDKRDEGCWLWKAARKPKGYGTFRAAGKTLNAHRFAYEAFVGPIPEGLVIDHLCGNPPCVRPDHLEPVTTRTNLQRGRAGMGSGRCRSGLHDVTLPENVYVSPDGKRMCKPCRSAHQMSYQNQIVRCPECGKEWRKGYLLRHRRAAHGVRIEHGGDR
jgi:ribosomal protein L37AE/L43A